MARALLAAVLVAAVATAALGQMQVCDPKLRVGPIKSIYMKGTTNSGSYSSITAEWPRPYDGPSGGLNSCISEYNVDVYKAGTQDRVINAQVSVSPAHDKASYTANGLTPGNKYEFFVYGRNPSLGASGNGGGLKSQPFTAAPKPSAPSCSTPGAVYNIRREFAVNTGSTAKMTIAWNAPQTTPSECIKSYTVDVYPAGKTMYTDRIKSVTIQAPQTSYTDGWYTAGQSYDFVVAVHNPTLGASGNGPAQRGGPFLAPVGAATAGH